MPSSVLIVEDEQSLLKALSETLSRNDVHVLTAQNGQEGLAAALQHKPDLIVLDLLMPVMNGEDMLDLLRKDSWGAEVPVIILSNVSKTADVTRNVSRVVDGKQLNDYFVKADTSIEQIVQLVVDKLQR